MTDLGSPAPGELPGGFDAPGDLGATSGGAGAGGGGGGGGGNFDLPSFSRAAAKAVGGPIELLKDVDLNVKIELGRTRMLIEDVLRLAEGSVVELDKLAGDPVDVYVNEQLVARGEVLVLNDNFCVRINEIVTAIDEE
jgi:flagellar motor switch protein FliN/FliY